MSLKDKISENNTTGNIEQPSNANVPPAEKQKPPKQTPKVSAAELIVGIVLLVVQLFEIIGSVKIAHARGMSYSPLSSLSSVGIAAFLGENIFGIIGIILILHWRHRKANEPSYKPEDSTKRFVYVEPKKSNAVSNSEPTDPVHRFEITNQVKELEKTEEPEELEKPDEPEKVGTAEESEEEIFFDVLEPSGSKQKRSQRRFAIATAIMAVVLIASIVSLIVVSKNYNAIKSDNEQLQESIVQLEKNNKDLENKLSEKEMTLSSLRSQLQYARDSARQYQADCVSLQNEIDSKEEKMQDLQYEVMFYEIYAVIVANDGTNNYHKYGCQIIEGKRFWVYGTMEAISKGFDPCPYCTKEYFYIGDKNTYTYHRASCIVDTAFEDTIYFDTKEEAKKAGYHACSICKP